MSESKVVTTTEERVKAAAEKCGDAKAVLKELFPDVFKEYWEDVTKRACLWYDGVNPYPWIRIDGLERTDAFITEVTNSCNVGVRGLKFKVENGRIWRKKD